MSGAWTRWLAAAGPWRGWSVCPCLTVATRGVQSTSENNVEVEEVGLELLLRDEGTAVVVDLEPTLGVHLAAHASEKQLAHVVLVLPRWPHADAVLPAEPLVSTLVDGAKRLTHTPKRNVIFVLDGERRRALPHRRPGDQRVDNRYDITPGDLPTLAELRKAGIRRVVKVTRDG